MDPNAPLFTKYTFGNMLIEDLYEMFNRPGTNPFINATAANKTPNQEVAIVSPPESHAQPTSASSRTASFTASRGIENTNSDDGKKSVFIVLQHSESAGKSAMLPVSSVVGVYSSLEEAVERLHSLKQQKGPVVKKKTKEAMEATSRRMASGRRVKLWCTSDGEDEDELGFRYTSALGEEFVVWIEEHELK
ncbi:uncharacterized protein LTR77_000483 [Saxophila tyrrhenica]|uniref:Uncharacterized protein n=1 Tax=Saxophila tyrrhenica TaxID=1690608 RepID=A0AAV9PQP0_9PEZI|nr:hypothetical protein LTR77_000483 [Saxophila tyrrhenica]